MTTAQAARTATRRPLPATLAVAACITACSFTGLDDLGTEPCKSALDCFQLGGHRTALTDCPRCESGVCVYGDEMRSSAQSLADTELATLTATRDRPDHPILLIGTGDRLFYARGWQVTPGSGASAGTRIDYRDDNSAGCPLSMDDTGSEDAQDCSISEHANVWVTDDHTLGASVNRTGCTAAGQLRVGISRAPDTPFRLSVDSAGKELRFGVDGEVPADCQDWAGATAPAVAAVCDEGSACEQALVVWIAAPRPAGNTRAGVAELRAQQVRLQTTPSVHVRSTRACGALGEAFTDVAPRVLASLPGQAPGYLVAHANPDGLVLTSLDARDPCDAPHSIVLDTRAHAIALVRGPSDGAHQDVLLVWTSGADGPERLEAAVVRWRADALDTRERFTLREPRKDTALHDPPSAAFSAEGFLLGEARGGWAVTWTEQRGATHSVLAARVAHAMPEPGLHAVERLSDAGRLPFVVTDGATPFAFGFISTGDNASQLTVLSCR